MEHEKMDILGGLKIGMIWEVACKYKESKFQCIILIKESLNFFAKNN
jgi:hypothetical protein